MWLNKKKAIESAIRAYRQRLLSSRPNHVVIDGLFDESKLDDVMKILCEPHGWETQKHTYSSLYVDNAEWNEAPTDERFVKRDMWQKDAISLRSLDNQYHGAPASSAAHDFLLFLRSDEFMSLLSRIFNVALTDKNVADPNINTNYFRLSASDFVEQHADDSPGREVCMLLYLNKEWKNEEGGELVFLGENQTPVSITPLFNRCVLFDPSSRGSEHLVNKLKSGLSNVYRYNVTSWYWSE